MLQWENVVIGNSLDAVIAAKDLGAKFLYSDDPNFAPFTTEQEEYDRQYFDMSVRGQCPITGPVEAIRIDHETNEMSIHLSDVGAIRASYRRLLIFNSTKVSGLPFQVENRVKINKVYDWFKTNADRDNDYWEVEDPGAKFVSMVLFYMRMHDENDILSKTLPAEGNNPRNVFSHMVAMSELTMDQIDDTRYSLSMSRLKTMSMCANAGIRGLKNGFTTTGTPRFKPMTVSSAGRQVVPVYEQETREHKNIIFNNMAPE